MIKIILAAFFFSYYFVEIALFPNAIKKALNYPFTKRIKPIDCVTCLSVWVAVVLWFCPVSFSDFILTIFAAGYLGNFLSK